MLAKKSEKIFCIGLNKTGTTTIERVLLDFDYKMGDQAQGELLLKSWFQRDFKSIIRFCKKAQAFQDIPFSLPITYIFLDQYYKNSKFILTVRDNPEQWYNSITKFHSKLWSHDLNPPTTEDLKQATYRYKGWAYEVITSLFNTPENSPYEKNTLQACYENHNYTVMEYFRSRPEKLLVINVSRNEDYVKLCRFLGRVPQGDDFPWENKTDN